MNSQTIRTTIFATFLFVAAATAQAQVCVKIDESYDTLGTDDRRAAVLVLSREFAQAGEPTAADCSTPYLLSHITLGNRLMVTLSGPKGDRQGTALGLEDLPALYNQMVRSLITGRPMTGLAVVDRNNVTAAQASDANRVRSDSFTYARLGYGCVFGNKTRGLPSFGFGYRAELDKVAIDVSFLNLQVGDSDYDGSGSAGSSSLVKLSGLYLLNRRSNSTAYFGGGLSWGRTHIDDTSYAEVRRPATSPSTVYSYTTGGSGLQGELTAGHEFGRATTIRMFVQADATLPFYSVSSQTISSRGVITSTTNQYTPTLALSVGFGWGRNRR